MRMKVVGISARKSGEFEGNPWSYHPVYVTYVDGSVSGLQGMVAEMLKVKDHLFSGIQVGSQLDVEFNRFGKISALKVVS